MTITINLQLEPGNLSSNIKVKRRRAGDAGREYSITLMDSAMKGSSGTITGMALEFSNSIKFRSIEDSGQLMSFQAREK